MSVLERITNGTFESIRLKPKNSHTLVYYALPTLDNMEYLEYSPDEIICIPYRGYLFQNNPNQSSIQLLKLYFEYWLDKPLSSVPQNKRPKSVTKKKIKKELERQVLNSEVHLLTDNLNCLATSRKLGVSISTLASYRRSLKRRLSRLIVFKIDINRYKDLLQQFIEEEDNAFKPLRELKIKFENSQSYLQCFGNKRYSYSQFYKIVRLRQYLNYSFKQPQKYSIFHLNSQELRDLRKEYVINYIRKRMSNKIPIYIDETGFKLGVNKRKGLSIRGCRTRHMKTPKQTKNITFLSAITSRGTLACMFIKGGLNGDTFYYFIASIINTFGATMPNYFFVLDNLRAHKKANLYSQVQRHADFLFLSPYSPFLNPIEYYFSYIKRKFRIMAISQQKQILSSVLQICFSIEERHFKAFEYASFNYFISSIDGLDIDLSSS